MQQTCLKKAYNTYFFTKLQRSINGDIFTLSRQTLFFDPILSVNNSVSCASCHKPNMVYTDGLPKSYGFKERHVATQHTHHSKCCIAAQSVYGCQCIGSEDQAKTVVQNEREMHMILKL